MINSCPYGHLWYGWKLKNKTFKANNGTRIIMYYQKLGEYEDL